MSRRTGIVFVSPSSMPDKPGGPLEHAGLPWVGDVVQETCRPDKVDMYFDAGFLRCLVALLAESLGADAVRCNRQEGDGEDFQAYIAGQSVLTEVDQEPPDEVIFAAGGKALCVVKTEPWTRCGGPRPYADNYAYAVYSRSLAFERLAEIAAAAADKAGCEFVVWKP
jgi:hypothetical protein